MPSFILTFVEGMGILAKLLMPEWRNRQTRTTQNRVPKGMWVRFPPSALKLYFALGKCVKCCANQKNLPWSGRFFDLLFMLLMMLQIYCLGSTIIEKSS
jgi:hypothetical protein